MPPKKRSFANSASFRKGGENVNRFTGMPSTDSLETRVWTRSRSEGDVTEGEPPTNPGQLRSFSCSNLTDPCTSAQIPPPPTPSAAENWIVSEEKLTECMNKALAEHGSHIAKVKGRNKGHTPVLEKLNDRRIGFGVVVRYRCKFKNCRFESSEYELFERTEDGQVSANLQAGTAMAKSDLTPTKVEFLSTVMNIKPPARKTLQKKYNQALEVAEPLAELAMADNRKKVYDSLEQKGALGPGIPDAEGSADAQYPVRSYHVISGTSKSASIPVIEHETGDGGLIQHSSLSQRDGTLTTHINHAEGEGAALNYEKTYTAPQYPLALRNMTGDGDASVLYGYKRGMAAVGDSKTFRLRAGSYHKSNAAKRKFMREALKPMSNLQRQKLSAKNLATTVEDPEVKPSNTCPKCGGTFKNSRGVTIHERRCQGSQSELGGVVGLEPMFARWSLAGNSVNAAEKKVFRNGVSVWLMSRIKGEFYKGLAVMNPEKSSMPADGEIKARLVAAGRTIVKCITGNHEACGSDSFICMGEMEPVSFTSLPRGQPLADVPTCVLQWLSSIVDEMLSQDALEALVINGRYGTTSLVESVHHEIRKTVPKGFPHTRNETRLIKSGVHAAARKGYARATLEHLTYLKLVPSPMQAQMLKSLQRAHDYFRNKRRTQESKTKKRAYRVNQAKVGW